jgi:hypothetical protein
LVLRSSIILHAYPCVRAFFLFCKSDNIELNRDLGSACANVVLPTSPSPHRYNGTRSSGNRWPVQCCRRMLSSNACRISIDEVMSRGTRPSCANHHGSIARVVSEPCMRAMNGQSQLPSDIEAQTHSPSFWRSRRHQRPQGAQPHHHGLVPLQREALSIHPIRE